MSFISFFLVLAVLQTLMSATVFAISAPTGVTGTFVNGTKVFIMTWAYQQGVDYYEPSLKMYHRRPDIGGWVNGTTSTVFKPNCSADKPCSFCFANGSNTAACGPEHLLVIGVELYLLDYEDVVKIRVSACTQNDSDSCIYRSGWKGIAVPPGVPGPVRSVRANATSSKVVHVFWKAPSVTRGTITKYTVYYNSTKLESKDFSGEVYMGVLAGLKVDTTYTIWVTASTSAHEGEKSEVVSVQTHSHECVSSPCTNGGTCEASAESYTCSCTKEWEGTNCDEPVSAGAALKASFAWSAVAVIALWFLDH